MLLPTLPCLDPARKPGIQAHLDDLTKPQGSLGRLESLALQMAWISGELRPPEPEAFILTFAGDHGIARQGVSAFPPEVTPQMVANIAAGGAAISVLCRTSRIQHRVIDVGVAVPCPWSGVGQRNVMRGTADAAAGPAMTRAQAEASLQAGMDEVASLPEHPFALLGLGEMGIANSAIAALLVSAFAGIDPQAAVGPGTGIKGQALQHKLEVIRTILERQRLDPSDPVGVLAAVGGCEFGAMAGAMLAGAARGWAVIVDGYIAGAAALVALAVPILRSACAVAREMATFSGAGVSTADCH